MSQVIEHEEKYWPRLRAIKARLTGDISTMIRQRPRKEIGYSIG